MHAFPLEKYQAFLFDLDGTLADSMPLHNQAWIATFAQRGCSITEEIILEYAGVQNPRTVELLNERFGWKLDPHELAEEKEARFFTKIEKVVPVAAVLAIARANLHKSRAIVSGGSRDLVGKILNALQLAEIFPMRVCAEDTKLGKPNPDPFLKAAELLGVKPEQCLVFEDGDPGIQAAKAAGMGVVKVGRGPNFKLEFLAKHS